MNDHDRVLKNQFFFNNNNNQNSDSNNNTKTINGLNAESFDQDFYEIYQFFAMISTQDIVKFCNKESVLRIPIIPPTIVQKLCESVKKIFESENILLRLKGQMIIVGDLHGHIMDLFRIIKRFGLPPRTRYLFLGDIVDRGEFSLETIIFIYAMKALFPNEIYIIRGNHEFEEVCSLSGFLDDISATYKSKDLFSFFIESFDVMPIAAVINDSILCVHAGIGPNINSINNIIEEETQNNVQSIDFNSEKQNLNNKIQRPIHDFSNDIIASLMWSDPTEKKQENRTELPSLISPLTGARILTVRPIIENKRTKRAISNDFNINHLKLGFPKNQRSDDDTINEIEQSHLADLRDKKEDESNNSNSENKNLNENINYSYQPESVNFSNSDDKYADGFSPSSRGYGYLFDKRSFDTFVNNSKISLLLRGHQCVHNGISNTFDNRLTTVFSASHYCGSSNNSSGVFVITKYGNRTESFKSLPYLRRGFVVFIPPERYDSFVIPSSLSSFFQTTEQTFQSVAFTARPRINSCINPSSSNIKISQQQQQQQPTKKKASIFSPASLIATKACNPLATFEQDTAHSEDDEIDPFEIHDCDDERESESFDERSKKGSKRHSALAQISKIGAKKVKYGGANQGFASDEQENLSRRFLRLPCINVPKKHVFYGDF